MLLPYYFIRYEKVFSSISVDLGKTEETEKIVADMLEKDLATLYILYQLIGNVSNQIFRNQQTIRERMIDFMGGEVLEFEWDIEYRKQMKEAKEEGRNEGRSEGQDINLLSLICRKLQKGKSVTVIADELEDDPERIGHICKVAERFAPEYDVEKIYEALHSAWHSNLHY